MSENARKAVITTAQVQEAVSKFAQVLSEASGKPVGTVEFDKGHRGKGYATYNSNGEVIETFETKEDAYVKFSNFAEAGRQVMDLIAAREVPAESPKTASKATQKPAA
jgi:hypothetical protein